MKKSVIYTSYLQFMRTIISIFFIFLTSTFLGQTSSLTQYISGCWVSTKAVTPDMKEIKTDGCGTILIRPDTIRFLDANSQKKQKHFWKVVNDTTVETTHYWSTTELKKEPSLSSINPAIVPLNIRRISKDEFIGTNFGSECRPVQYFVIYRRINCR